MEGFAVRYWHCGCERFGEDTPAVYAALDAKLHGRNLWSRKVANNTYLHRVEGVATTLAVELHETDIITITTTGLLTLDSGGWRTMTTKARINDYLPVGFSLYTERGVWYLSCPSGDVLNYADGMTIDAENVVRGYALPDLAADKALKKRISAYAKLCAESLPLSMPSGGDCWYCAMREVKTGKPLGEATQNTDHLSEHMREGYVVPSLVWQALEAAGYTAGRNFPIFGAAFYPHDRMYAGFLGIAQDHVRKSVRRYMSKQFGYQA